jgi:hypothetical protein
MFKVDETGMPVEVWPQIKLTEEDLKTIAVDIAEHTALPTMRKVNGIWQQRSSLDVMDYGYRIHEREEEEDALAQLDADLQERALMLQIQEVTEDV